PIRASQPHQTTIITSRKTRSQTGWFFCTGNFIRSARSAGSCRASRTVIQMAPAKNRMRYAHAAGQRMVPAAPNSRAEKIRASTARVSRTLTPMGIASLDRPPLHGHHILNLDGFFHYERLAVLHPDLVPVKPRDGRQTLADFPFLREK